MTDRQTATTDSSANDTDRQDILNEIGAKWSKFSRKELSNLTTIDQLVSQIGTKYGVKKEAAQRQVDMLMDGRNLTA
ncbi:hypothetical protein [Reyranella sp.]|uniref:hypothetical protein n=1 Tax=Reyranella sp. TaxID=1929291 RepID=UPI00121C2508|nr:hypothetical protein [Reyranella sp.]TAJ88625.1 MAG: hypothetical protein EPO50_07570 [Reyranella sp.]